MNCEIITDRFEIEKLAEDIFITSSKKGLMSLDYADLRITRRRGVFKIALSLKVEMLTANWTQRLIELIKSHIIPVDKLNTILVYFFVDGVGESMISHKDATEILCFVNEYLREEAEQRSDEYVDLVWAVYMDNSLPKNCFQATLMFSYAKTPQDELEDEQYQQMIEEYRQQFLY